MKADLPRRHARRAWLWGSRAASAPGTWMNWLPPSSSKPTWMPLLTPTRNNDKTMPSRRSSSVWGACFLPLVALIILAVILLAVGPSIITNQAEALFGPASPGLSGWQRLKLGVTLVLQADDLTEPVDRAGGPVSFTILSGESVPSITQRLWQAGLISNPGAFRSYLQYAGMDTTLQAGDYTLSAGMSAVQIAQAMQSSISSEVTLVILAGWRMEEIAAALPSSGLEITPEDVFTGCAGTSARIQLFRGTSRLVGGVPVPRQLYCAEAGKHQPTADAYPDEF